MNAQQLQAIKHALDVSALDPDSEAMHAARKAIADFEELQRVSISIVWQIDDVLSVRPDLTEDEAAEVLHEVESAHDCEQGITWFHIESAASYMFGDAPDEDEEGEE